MYRLNGGLGLPDRQARCGLAGRASYDWIDRDYGEEEEEEDGGGPGGVGVRLAVGG
ncbi:MAG: hypothetical protein LBJ62_08200 [Bifidobacteriaceae bacterium]|nr:hypothetical protein [Bifidobacteriaceae bacterium]